MGHDAEQEQRICQKLEYKVFVGGRILLLDSASRRAVPWVLFGPPLEQQLVRLSERVRRFPPVLEVLNPDTLGSDGLKVVTLDLGGGKLGNSSDAIQIIVKNCSEFAAPASDGLTRPDGNKGDYFMWSGNNNKRYAPGESVPADVTELTAQWTAPTYTVTLHERRHDQQR